MSSSTSCSVYEAKIASAKVTAHTYDVDAAESKGCKGPEAADLTQYVWDYKNDENKDMGLEVGAVIHNREWSYGLVKFASLVQVAVSFKARCTFSFKQGGATRTLRVIDDTGYKTEYTKMPVIAFFEFKYFVNFFMCTVNLISTFTRVLHVFVQFQGRKKYLLKIRL